MQIQIVNLSKTFGKTEVLKGMNMRFESGHIYGIVGGNGSGKTMLLRAVSGLILPSEGQIVVDGKILHKDISFPPSMGILIEKPEFLKHLSGFENLKLLAEIKGLVSDEKLKDYLELFGLDAGSKLPMRKYSLGMKQKIGIIQAIMEEPELLVLDEAFNALDEAAAALLGRLLLQYKKEGRLIILTSHHKEDIEALCDYVYRIKDGRMDDVKE